MQPTYVKLKLPIKAIQVLLFIMLSLQHCTVSSSQLRCFGPVWKTKVYNNNHGYVYINQTNQKIMINKNNDSFLYKISTTYEPADSILEVSSYKQKDNIRPAFYLFDPNTKRFLCWKSVNGPVVGLSYDKIANGTKNWDLCKFSDGLPDDGRYHKTYVNLQLAFQKNVTLSFDRKGHSMSQRRMQKCLHRNQIGRHSRNARKKNKCLGNNLFLLYYDNVNKVDEHCCGTAYKTLCQGKTANMKELAEVCSRRIRKKRLHEICH